MRELAGEIEAIGSEFLTASGGRQSVYLDLQAVAAWMRLLADRAEKKMNKAVNAVRV